jgi:FG-GAP repeat
MKSTSRWGVLVVCLAVLLIARDGALSQSALADDAGAPPRLRQVAYLKSSNPHAGDHFGCGGSLPGHIGNSSAVSADGNYIAIGAHLESSASKGINADQNDTSVYATGAVYVFARRGATWVQQAYIKASNPQMGANLGMNVALNADGTTLAASAYFESSSSTGINSVQDDNIPQAGAVYVFTRAGNTWSQQAYIKASNTGRPANLKDPNDWGDGDQFGHSVALSGDGNTLAVGAPSEDSRATSINNTAFEKDDSANSSGAVYVFARAGGQWSQQAYVKGANTDAGDLFGYVVALSTDGDTMAVCAYDEDGSGRFPNAIPDNLSGGTGAGYVFVRTDGVWRQQAYLKGSRIQRNDSLISIAISGDGNTIAGGSAEESCLVPGINSPGCDIDTFPPHISGGSAGAVYIWVRNGNNWTEQSFIKASNPDIEDIFAYRVALSSDGSTLLVGAPNEDSKAQGIDGNQMDNSALESGAAYLFTRAGTVWTQKAYIKGSNTRAFDLFGSSVAMSGDGTLLLLGAPIESGGAQGVNADQNDTSAQGAGAGYVFTYN